MSFAFNSWTNLHVKAHFRNSTSNQSRGDGANPSRTSRWAFRFEHFAGYKSGIAGFGACQLDLDNDGTDRKPDSLIIEAVKRIRGKSNFGPLTRSGPRME